MRQTLLLQAVGALVLLACGCRSPEGLQLEPTDESVPVLKSSVRAGDQDTSIQLLRGFHRLEENVWRWTMGRFSVVLLPPPGSNVLGATLEMEISVPQAVLDRSKSVKLTASVQGSEIGAQMYEAAGDYQFTCAIPASLLQRNVVGVDFALDPFIPSGVMDARELGVVFLSATLRRKDDPAQ